MLEDDTRAFAAAAASLVLVALLTFPSVIAFVSHFRAPNPKSTLYEDKDGVATEESVAEYTAKVPKILFSLFTIVGLSTSIALAALSTLNRDLDPMLIENWVNVAQWVCLHC